METFRTERSISERMKELEDKLTYGKMKEETHEKESKWKMPFKWSNAARQSKSKVNENKVLVLYLNIKGEIEPPVLVPLFGDVIIYKNRAHEFDPRAAWIMKMGKNTVKVVLIKQIDRRPVSNLDIDEIKRRGDSTDSDEILVKMVTRAVMEKVKKPIDKRFIIGGIIALLIVVVYFFFIKK